MTHRYTILTGGNILPALDESPVTAIAWAGDTVIALGRDEEVVALSRGDSRFVPLGGAWVVPWGHPASGHTGTRLEIGGPADLAILPRDPRKIGAPPSVAASPDAVIRGGRVVAGRMPGGADHEHGDHDHEQGDHDHEHQRPVSRG